MGRIAPQIPGGVLTVGPSRFIVAMIADAMEREFLDADAFVRWFTPLRIAHALASEPLRRSRLLEVVLGMPAAAAREQTIEGFARALEVALRTGDADAEIILQAIPRDIWPRLGLASLWDFALETKFWTVARSSRREAAARAHARVWIEGATANRLVTSWEILEGLAGVSAFERLPRVWRVGLLETALAVGRHRRAIANHDLVHVLPWAELANRVPLDTLWSGILCPVLEPRFVPAPSGEAGPEGVDQLIKDRAPAAMRVAQALRPAKGHPVTRS